MIVGFDLNYHLGQEFFKIKVVIDSIQTVRLLVINRDD